MTIASGLTLSVIGVPRRYSYVIMTARFQASSHVAFLALPERQPDPVLVAKVPRLPGVSASVVGNSDQGA